MAYTNNLHVVYGEASLGVNGQDSPIYSATSVVALNL